MKHNKNKEIASNILIGLSVIIAIIGLFSPFIIKNYIYIKNMKLDEISTWIGSSTTPLLTFAGIVLLLATLLTQREELKSQKEELELTREELKKQNYTFELQRFENTFFKLLSFNNEIVNSMHVNGEFSYGKEGRVYFKYAYESLKKIYSKKNIVNVITDTSTIRDEYEDMMKVYMEFYECHQEQLGHYFRNLYHIIKFIDMNNEITENDKNHYVSLVRAQLSTFELILIFYNVLSPYGKEKFKPLIIKYKLLKNINGELLINKTHLAAFKIF